MRLTTRRDIDAVYALFLGRLPENNRIYHSNIKAPFEVVTENIIGSDEFDSILTEFLRRGVLPHFDLTRESFQNAIEVAIEAGLAPVEMMALHPEAYGIANLELRDGAEFIEAAYRVLLARDAAAAELQADLAALEGGTRSKQDIVDDLLKTEEHLALTSCWRVVRGDGPREDAEGADVSKPRGGLWMRALGLLYGGDLIGHILDVRHGAAGQEFVGRLKANAASADELLAEYFKMWIDNPEVVDGRLDLEAQGAVFIDGWALARDGVASIETSVDGTRLTRANYGSRRRDVAAAHPDWPNSLESGWSTLIPSRRLPRGTHHVEVILRDLAGRSHTAAFSIVVGRSVVDYPTLRRKIGQSEINLEQLILSKLDWHPRFRLLLLMSREEAEVERTRATLLSLSEQAYGEWRVFVALRRRSAAIEALRDGLIDGSQNPKTLSAGRQSGARDTASLRERLLAGLEDIAGRVEILKQNGFRSLAELIEGEPGETLFSILDAGDELSCDALLEFAVASGMDRGADFFYCDEWRISPESGDLEPFLKPQWSPDLLLSSNYVGRLWCAAGHLAERAETSLDELVRFGEYGLVLRLTELARAVRHVPELLCRRADERIDGEAAERRALQSACARRGWAGDIHAGCVQGTYRLRRSLSNPGLVSIIIPTCASGGMIKRCIETLRELTAYRRYRIVAVDNIAQGGEAWKRWLRAAADQVVEIAEPFNWSRFNNRAVAEATGEFLLFLNDDIEIIEPDWLDALLEHGQRPEVGVVGAQLLYPDRTVQHAGMFLSPQTGYAMHAFRGSRSDSPGYFGLALTQRNVVAVTGACMLTRRDTFDRLGGFAEAHRVANNDLDYCLRAWQQGLAIVYTPYAKLVHYECGSRSGLGDDFDVASFEQRWHAVFALGDPYHHRFLYKDMDRMAPDPEPPRVICSRAPLLTRESVRRILVVKLDHIGDVITIFPALRRLKELFPGASLRALASRWTKPIWSLSGIVDEVIEFDFFHDRADAGKRPLTEADLAGLRTRLAPYRFDLAVDLRKHPETRHILQFTGARFLAGFDYDRSAPWLDIALEATTEPKLAPMRHPIGEDLINLVDAIAARCETGRTAIAVAPGASCTLPQPVERRLFARRVVCIHPAAGEVLRQWPPKHFAELIDLLVEQEEVNVALIGSRNDRETADQVLSAVRRRDAVENLVGSIGLDRLASFLLRCALFVGNNSGPHHLAAGLGVPTIGVHSAVVDARQWGAVGPLAITLRREMECGPCYLGSPADCPREVACLTGLRPSDVHRACRRLLAIGFGERPSAGAAAPGVAEPLAAVR